LGDGAIRLSLPADPEYGRVARTAVASLGLRAGFAYVDIEDLRLAIDEVLILLLHPEGGTGRVTLRFEPTAQGLVIDADRSPVSPIDPGALGRFEELVAPIVDTWAVDVARASVHLVKTRGEHAR
jgi:hypothetical protein